MIKVKQTSCKCYRNSLKMIRATFRTIKIKTQMKALDMPKTDFKIMFLGYKIKFTHITITAWTQKGLQTYHKEAVPLKQEEVHVYPNPR